MPDPPRRAPESKKVYEPVIPKAAPGNYNSIAAQYARAKAAKEQEEREREEKNFGDILTSFGLGGGEGKGREGSGKGKGNGKGAFERLNEVKELRFRGEWGWVVGFWVWLL
jgi:GPI ethanolamine phosphate transferase 3 subunit O